MTDPSGTITDGDTYRELTLQCDHGDVLVTDTGPGWNEDQLLGFARSLLQVRARCRCFSDDYCWIPADPPEHVEIRLRVYAKEDPEPELEGVSFDRPQRITPWAVSLAAERAFETATPDDHSLQSDIRLVRWWQSLGGEDRS